MAERCTGERAGRQCRRPARYANGAGHALLALAIACSSAAKPESQAAPPRPRESARAAAQELELLSALPIEAPEDFEPSGLWIEQGRLLVVSDKHDDTVYELGLEAERAVARSYARLKRVPEPGEHLDWEGLTGDGVGGLLVVSESAYRVARIEAPRDGESSRDVSWITPSLRAAGEAVGCFGAPNAGFEGIARLDDGTLLLAIERLPRGLMHVGVGTSAPLGRARAMPDSIFPVQPGRAPDFTDLAVAGGNIYALMRNGQVVLRLEQREGAWEEGQGVSYAAAEDDPRFIYADATFGLAEGLALTSDQIFVVLDNNGQARAAAPTDSRPLLFVFRRPPGF